MEIDRQGFNIPSDALEQIRRLDAIFSKLLAQPNLAIPHTTPRDVHGLVALVRDIRQLPGNLPREDRAVVIYTSTDPRKPFYRLQFGPRVIRLCSVQVAVDPDDPDQWLSNAAFGALLGLAAGCGTTKLVEELKIWIDELEGECCRTSVIWRMESGTGHIGQMAYPSHLEDDAA